MSLKVSPRLLMHLFFAGVASLGWVFVAVRATIGDVDLSARGLLAGLALVAVGVCVGVVMWIAGAPRRARRGGSAAADMEPASALLLGLMSLGLAASAGLDAASGAWWSRPLVALGCTVGGLQLAVAFMMSAEPRAGVPLPATGAADEPQRGAQIQH